MNGYNSLGDRAVAIASALAILFAVAFGSEPAPDANPPGKVAAAHRTAR
jgi:hypothetical protein